MFVEGESAAAGVLADGPLHRNAVGGFAETRPQPNPDRPWRNAHAVAGHNPLAYKADAADNYAANGVWPPANVYF
jgi:hypothetical protein